MRFWLPRGLGPILVSIALTVGCGGRADLASVRGKVTLDGQPLADVPFIVAGPGVSAGAKINAPIYLQDVMPTTLELAGVKQPPEVEFHSLLPLLRGQQTAGNYPAIFGAYLQSQRSVTYDGWKLILYPRAKVARMYHVAADPQEIEDLAGDAKHEPRKKQLFDRLMALQRELGDPLELAKDFPGW